MEEREVEEADARGESKGDAVAVDGVDMDSTVLEMTVLFMADWPPAETAVEGMMVDGDNWYLMSV